MRVLRRLHPVPVGAVLGASALLLAACGSTGSTAADSPAAGTSGEAASGSTTTASAQTDGTGCPVDAEVLAAAAAASDEVDHADILADTVECYEGWAIGTPDLEGDGYMVFSYDAATGGWTAVTQGSSIMCTDIGMPAEVGEQLGACES